MVFETTAYADSAIKPAGSFYQQIARDRFTAHGVIRYPAHVVVHVNGHTTGAAEMLAYVISRRMGLAPLFAAKPQAGSFHDQLSNLGHDDRIVIPIGAYVSWKGNREEGKGIPPMSR
jgi:hypothetical protein